MSSAFHLRKIKLFDAARATYDHHIKYKDLLKEKVNQFKVTQHQLQTLYGLHRKKAKLVFQTSDEIREGHTLITKLEQHRSDYFRAKGEYQLSTTTKEQALNALHQWILTLQATAKIAFMENKGVVHLLEGKS